MQVSKFFWILLVLCAVNTAVIYFVNNHVDTNHHAKHRMKEFQRKHFKTELKELEESRPASKPPLQSKTIETQKEEKVQLQGSPNNNIVDDHHKIAGLSCEAFGGPYEKDVLSDVVYWSDIPSDASYQSPFYDPDGEEKFMTFEPDGGGWNNIRMAMETVFVLAHAMGRTLVIPPSQKLYLLGKAQNRQKSHFSFADFYHLDSIELEHEGIKLISMEEFLQKTAMQGKLLDKDTGKPSFPPGNRTDWNGMKLHEKDLWIYLRQVTHVRNWKPQNCLAAFPASSDPKDVQNLVEMMQELKNNGGANSQQFVGNPVPVDAPPIMRLSEELSDRRELCIYDEEMQKAEVVHFMCYHKERARLLTHFYSFVYFENWKQDLWAKRFVRDHFRYIDELQCAAARVIHAIRERAKSRNPLKNPEGVYDSYHIRRGDFQYKRTRLEAQQIYENSKDEMEEGATVYISTDESNKAFFKPLADHYDIVFLDDFKDVIKGLNTNYYGMLDQLVASRGRVFFGTGHSTFSGFINRMRGYYNEKHKIDGYEDGVQKSYYFAPMEWKYFMTKYFPIASIWAREYPSSWRDIDHGIGEI